MSYGYWASTRLLNRSTDSDYESWDVVVRDLRPEQLPLKPILKKED